ncbi:MAG: methyl-accepting chemotaxis protein [Pseudomonadota bacterium]
MRDFTAEGHSQAAEEPAVYNENAAIVQSIRSSYAFIEFTPDGTILRANDHFLNAVGYTLDEIVGKHHSIFMPPDEVNTPEYREHWSRVGRGEFLRGSFKRLRKDGTPIWIAATYSPLHDKAGNLKGAFKIAIDLTEDKVMSTALTAGLQGLSNGDLGARITGEFSGDNRRIVEAFNQTMDRLSEVVSGFFDGADRLGNVTGGLSSRAGELTQRAESLSSAIEQSGATIRSLAEALGGLAEDARKSESMVRMAADRSRSGAKTVEGAVTSMKAIESITADISKITKVIEGFAFQTNLLSINAAVEAARAGEAGKGFAVVATEVRSLAERSAKASQDIAELISRSEAEVAKGVTQVGAAGEALEEINTAVDDTVRSVGQIAEGTSNQVIGTKEVTAALAAMERDTAHLAAMADANGGAAADLATQVDGLRGLIQAYARH